MLKLISQLLVSHIKRGIFSDYGHYMDKNLALLACILFTATAAFSFEPKEYIHSQYYTDISTPTFNESAQTIATGIDLIDVDLSNLTWNAFDSNGQNVRSGRVSGGKDYCPDIDRNCETVIGTFTIYRAGTEDCKSTIFPIGRGGAPMPYCMFFHGGYALHGSNSVPDYNASHGCVRMSPEDARWLNEEFVQVGITKVRTHY